MSSARRLLLMGLFGIMTILLIVGLLLPATVTQAQPGATARAQAQSVQATAQAQATELAGRRGSLTATIGAFQNELNATVEAAQGAVGTVEFRATEIAATIQYVSTAIYQSADSIQATATAISAAIEERLAAMPPEVSALLEDLFTQGSITYDREANKITVSSLVTEPQANDLLDILVEASGYNPDAASVDLQADGTVHTILVDVDEQLPGTLVLIYQPVLSDGHVNLNLVGVTLNGNAIPLELVPDDLLSAVQLGVTAAAQQPALNVPASGYSYTVESLSVTADHFVVVYAIALG